ncbi:MAG: hypothetical protein J1F18_11865 [Lachnospiraceae bacterium]|nr:hypothetical protein [Lachnospiraceae bacterium]
MKNKNKIILGLLMLCMAVILPACGKKEKELDAEEQQVKEELQAVFSDLYDEVDSDYNEEKDIDEEKVSFDPNEPGINDLDVGSGLDPYAMGIFDVFGFDENFPMPKESFETKWSYTTYPFSVDKKTGEQPEGVREYELELKLTPQSYSDYMTEITDYIRTKYGTTNKIYPNNQEDYPEKCVVFLDNDYILTFSDRWGIYNFQVVKAERMTVEGTVIEAIINMDGYPNKIRLKTDDGEDYTFSHAAYFLIYVGMDVPFYECEFEYPEDGDRVKVTYLKFYEGYMPSDSTEYITDFEYLSTVNDGGSDDGEDSTDLLDEAEESETE